jgi:AcrR family transcriptional regulator
MLGLLASGIHIDPETANSMSAVPRMRRVGRPKSDDVLVIRADILAAARRLFFEHGIAGTGMEAVAKATGVTKQTLYARFPNKSELCQAVMQDIMLEWRAHQGPLLEGVDSLEEALCRHTIRTLETATREGSALLAQFLSTESRWQPALTGDVLGAIRTKGIQDIETILDAFSSPGAGAAPGNRAAAEFYFMALIGKISDLGASRGAADGNDLAAWAGTAVKLFLAGFQPGAR